MITSLSSIYNKSLTCYYLQVIACFHVVRSYEDSSKDLQYKVKQSNKPY